MDFTELTLPEVETLIRQLNAHLDRLRREERDRQDARTTRIEDSIASLNALLGPEDAVPGVDSIRAVRGYDGATMAENAAIAFPLAFEGLEILTQTVRDIASTIAHNQRPAS